MAIDFSRNELSFAVPRGLDGAISAARRALLANQQADDTWPFESEADCTNPAEYILFSRHVWNRLGEHCGGRIEGRPWSVAGLDLAL